MEDGFLRAACATPKIKVADPDYNTTEIIKLMKRAQEEEVSLLVLPELCITGYTCNDLFYLKKLQVKALESLEKIKEESSDIKQFLTFVGLPFVHCGKLYNVAAAVYEGKVLGLIPKRFLPNYSEFYERRQFTPGFKKPVMVNLFGEEVPFGSNLLFENEKMPEMVVGAEICEDLWVPNPPSIEHALHGATVLVNLSGSNETIGKAAYRKNLVANQSARLVAAYLYASAGEGESTQDLVFGGHNLIAENGSVLAESVRFENTDEHFIVSDLDLERLVADRVKFSTYETEETEDYVKVAFSMERKPLELKRSFPKKPFVPSDNEERDSRCQEILNIQTYGLKKRMEHTNCKSAVIGISGGLDSTLALLVAVRTFDALKMDRKQITCVTMPAFGTTDRTYNNAVTLTEKLGCTLREINIKAAVRQHFADISHDESNHDVTYENSQARERTQILMDIANQTNGMVIGTGDLSELALGWATYNGDHMSMYGVNASVPKTLVRHLVRYYADTVDNEELKAALLDVLDTPVSPELLPPTGDGKISQKTEDLVGPYELHDFFLYHFLRFGYTPKKLYRVACMTFADEYDAAVVYKWLRTFTWRFFAQQFKRSCLPDGPKVGSIAVSPRGDLRMPSDASSAAWMAELDEIRDANGFT